MGSSTLAIVTTLHVALLLVRRHRSRPVGGQVLILVPAAVFAVGAWIVPQLVWTSGGLAAHVAWFGFCEMRFPAAGRQAAARIVSAPQAPRPLAAQPARPPAPRTPITVPVLAVFDETADIKTFRVRRPEGFDFTAGQFLTVRVQVDGNIIQRAYSISSAPLATGYLEISVKRIGLVSGVLHSTLRAGSQLAIRPPAGAFTYPTNDDRPLLLLAGGIGITPLMSMLRHAVATEPARPVTLIYSVRTPEDLAFRDELGVLARRHPQVRVVATVTQGPASDRWHRGRITPSIVSACTRDLPHTLACICGPQPMIDGMKALLAGLGVPPSQIRSESFGAVMKLVTSEAGQDDEPRSAPLSGLVVRFRRTGCEATVGRGQTLLEAAEAGGVDLPSLCRAGSCQTCRTRVVRGDVDCQSDALSEEDRAAGYVLPCVTRARTDCELEA